MYQRSVYFCILYSIWYICRLINETRVCIHPLSDNLNPQNFHQLNLSYYVYFLYVPLAHLAMT